MIYSKLHAEFLTVTCLEWNPLLLDNRFKDIVINSLRFLCKEERVHVYGFVIMSNHFHLIWQMIGEHKGEDVQRDFLKFTAQQILKHLRNEKHEMLDKLLVNATDRKYQVWERNSLGIPLWSNEVFWQKLEYIHNNPVKAKLCEFPEEYKYSSAEYYQYGKTTWEFLTRHED